MIDKLVLYFKGSNYLAQRVKESRVRCVIFAPAKLVFWNHLTEQTDLAFSDSHLLVKINDDK